MKYGEDEELAGRAICWQCVGELYLSKVIKTTGTPRECQYCENESPTFNLGEIADLIEQAFDQHYSRTPLEPDGYQWAMQKDPESEYSWEREGEQTIYAIMNAAVIDEGAARDVQELLASRHADIEIQQIGEETPFAEDAYYEEIMPSDREWREGWYDFKRSLKTEARFFSRTAAAQLASLFDDVDTMRTRDGRSLIVPAGPGTSLDHLFRARVFQSNEKLVRALERPDRELAAPPSEIAAAGRMNARGISTFYGATDAAIALAEVRPPVGSQVAIARFDIIRSLNLLDLNALSDIHETGSIFDPSYARRLGRMMFLRSFCQLVSRPVMPDDQDSEYLPTQAIADYLATEGKVPLDGILFPSVQAGGGLNAVLFYKASLCEELTFPKGTQLKASTAEQYTEGWEREYSVTERVPPEEPEKQSLELNPFALMSALTVGPVDRDLTAYREPAVRIVIGSMKVHVVGRVKFETDEFTVRRYCCI